MACRNHRNALHDVGNQRRFAQRVARRLGQQQPGLERDEIFLVRQDEIAQFGRVVLAGERVGVVPVRQQHDPHVQTVFQDHVDPAQRGFDAGAVAVVDHRHVAREAADQPDLPVRQRGARRGDHVFDPGLVHRDDVRVTFDQDAAVLLRDRPFGEIDSVQDVAFVVDLRFRRVQVFRDFLVGAHRPAAECGYASADPVDREHYPAAETVVIAARLAFDRQSGADQELLFVAVGQRLPRKSVAAVGTVAESEFPDRGRPRTRVRGNSRYRCFVLRACRAASGRNSRRHTTRRPSCSRGRRCGAPLRESVRVRRPRCRICGRRISTLRDRSCFRVPSRRSRHCLPCRSRST